MALFGIFGKGKKARGADEKSSGGASEETSKLAKAAAVRLEASRADKGGGQKGDGKTKFWRRQIPLGQLLIRKGMISDHQLEEALKVQKERRKSSPTGAITESYLGRILIDMHFIEEAELAKFLSVYWQIPFVELANVTIRKDVVALLSGDIARKYCVFPLHKVGRTVVLAMFNPTAQGLMEYISKRIGFQVKPAIGTRTDIMAFIDKYYPEGGDALSPTAADQVKGEPLTSGETTSMRIVPDAQTVMSEDSAGTQVAEAEAAPMAEAAEVVEEAQVIEAAEAVEEAQAVEVVEEVSDDEPAPVAEAVEEVLEAMPIAEEMEEVEEVGPDEIVPTAEAVTVPEAESDVLKEVEGMLEEVETVFEAESEKKATPVAGKKAVPVVDSEALSELKAKLAAGEDFIRAAMKKAAEDVKEAEAAAAAKEEAIVEEVPAATEEEELPVVAEAEEEAEDLPLALEDLPLADDRPLPAAAQAEEPPTVMMPSLEDEGTPVSEEEPEELAPLGVDEALALLEQERKSLSAAGKKEDAPTVKMPLLEEEEEEEEGPLPIEEDELPVIAEERPASISEQAEAILKDRGDEQPVPAECISEEEFSAALSASPEKQMEDWMGERVPGERDAERLDSVLFDLSTGARL